MSTSNQPFSQLLRKQKFYQTELISIGSNALALFVAILLAFSGWGAIALALKHLCYSGSRLLGSMILAKAKYQFINKTNLLDIKPYIKQAYHLTISRLITGVSGNIEKLLVGKIFGESTLGHYERGLFVVDKPNTFRNAITTPAMTYLATMSGPRLSQAYRLLSLFVLNIIGVPCLFFFLFGQELTILILGDQWGEAGSYVVWLSFLGLSLILKGLTNIMYINALRTKELSKLYWFSSAAVFIPVIFGFLFFNMSMCQFVILYSILSLVYWFIVWSITLINEIGEFALAFRAILYSSGLLVLFTFISKLLQIWLPSDSALLIVINLSASWVLSMILISFIFLKEFRLQITFVKDRIRNHS